MEIKIDIKIDINLNLQNINQMIDRLSYLINKITHDKSIRANRTHVLKNEDITI